MNMRDGGLLKIESSANSRSCEPVVVGSVLELARLAAPGLRQDHVVQASASCSNPCWFGHQDHRVGIIDGGIEAGGQAPVGLVGLV